MVATWAPWALAVYAVALAIVRNHPAPLAGAALWVASGFLIRGTVPLLAAGRADGRHVLARVLVALLLVVLHAALVLAGAAFVAHGSRST
ncbi:hypothetical protein [Cellulosimicrobium marinum]|uniref:hypothetical protein n=1 Tax=Cellulosimicrobium marinum TaxID=1638992 RepID=UPI001E3D750F|nr:hypothetical protein [Cellulosimicrobium marinum]MCB7135473.1 hypothetical protein [Cellulosimicrobium marinum]